MRGKTQGLNQSRGVREHRTTSGVDPGVREHRATSGMDPGVREHCATSGVDPGMREHCATPGVDPGGTGRHAVARSRSWIHVGGARARVEIGTGHRCERALHDIQGGSRRERAQSDVRQRIQGAGKRGTSP